MGRLRAQRTVTFALTRKSSGGLERFAFGMQGLAAGQWKAPVVTVIGEELLALTREGFEQGISPDGTPWLPTVKGNQPLIGETGALSGSVELAPGPDDLSVGVRITDEKVLWHQYGTKRGGPTTDPLRALNRKTSRGREGRPEGWHIVPRRMLPTTDNSYRWSLRIHVAAQAAFSAAFRRALP